MGNISAPQLLVLTIAAALICFTRIGRIFAGVSIGLGLVFAAWGTFVESYECPRTGGDCVLELQPTLAGPCTTSGQAGLLKLDGMYVLTAEAHTEARATCLDVRFWR
jgi:hypothetical protein